MVARRPLLPPLACLVVLFMSRNGLERMARSGYAKGQGESKQWPPLPRRLRLDNIQRFNGVNLELGYKTLAIYSPREVTTHERENED